MDGVALTVANYAHWLHHMGTDVCVMTPDIPGATYDYDYPVLRYLSLPVPMRKPYRYGLPQFDPKFKHSIAALPLQLVHAHSPFSAGDTARRLARERGIPMVATFHSKFKDDFMRIFHNDIIVNQLIKRIIDFFDQADEVWIPQASVGETLRSYGYCGPMEVVDNGNDFASCPCTPLLKQQAKVRLGISRHTPMLLFVGQHIWEKNTRLIIQALARITRQPWHMVFVGTGYAKDEMRKLVARLNLSHRVTFVDPITDREQLRQYYLAANLFVFPSLYDNAPLVVREAAAMHVPSIMLRGATAAQTITDGINGFLAQNGEQAFSQALSQLLLRPDVLVAAGNHAALTLTRSWQDIIGEVQDRYNHLIARHAMHRAV